MTLSKAPELALRYFHHEGVAYCDKILIKSVFWSDRGWKRHPMLRKRVTKSELRRLQREGASHVQLSYKGRDADFNISELIGGEVGARGLEPWIPVMNRTPGSQK